MKLKSLIGATVIAGTLLSGAVMSSMAGAETNPAPTTGWDNVNDRVTGAGSDTTYNFMQRAELLYNQADGCDTDNVSGSATIGNCLTGASQLKTDIKGNWDHDYFVAQFPTGSSAGVKDVQLAKVDYARSSRGPKSSGESTLNFWAYGKDALAFVTIGDKATANLTKAQIQGIYNCSITNWDQINDANGLPYASGVIEPVGMNSASGTKASMDAYLGFDANAGACVRKQTNGIFHFENDVKPLLVGPTSGITDINNAFWWMSYATYKAFSFQRQSAAAWTVDGKAPTAGTIAANTYPATRFVYHVTTKTAVTGTTGSADLTGADTGAAGAVREFTEFMCNPLANHTTNSYTGLTNYAEFTKIFAATGFNRLPTSEQTNGICRLVPAA